MMQQQTASMLQIYLVRNVNNEPQQHSYCYLCDNPKHKWTLIACRRCFKTVQSQMNNAVKTFYNYSDLSCKGFLTHICKQIKVQGHWYFTCPEELMNIHYMCFGQNKCYNIGQIIRKHARYRCYY